MLLWIWFGEWNDANVHEILIECILFFIFVAIMLLKNLSIFSDHLSHFLRVLLFALRFWFIASLVFRHLRSLDFSRYVQRPRARVIGELWVLICKELLLIFPEQQDSLLDGLLQILSLHLPFVSDVDVLEVAQLVRHIVRPSILLLLLLQNHFLIDRLQQGVLDYVVKCADHLF